MIEKTDLAYIAGLFDGEGSVNFTRRLEKKKKHKGTGHRTSNSMRISMEISMTDKSVLMWLHQVLNVGAALYGGMEDKPNPIGVVKMLGKKNDDK